MKLTVVQITVCKSQLTRTRKTAIPTTAVYWFCARKSSLSIASGFRDALWQVTLFPTATENRFRRGAGGWHTKVLLCKVTLCWKVNFMCLPPHEKVQHHSLHKLTAGSSKAHCLLLPSVHMGLASQLLCLRLPGISSF